MTTPTPSLVPLPAVPATTSTQPGSPLPNPSALSLNSLQLSVTNPSPGNTTPANSLISTALPSSSSALPHSPSSSGIIAFHQGIHPNSLHPAAIHLLRDDPTLSSKTTDFPSSMVLSDLQQQLGIDRTTLSIMGSEQPPPMLIPCPARAVGKWSFKLTPWKWTPFTPGHDSSSATDSNSSSHSGLVLHHWTRVDGNSDSDGSGNRFSPFAARPKADIVTYTEDEYKQVLVDDSWTKPDTDHLFDLCRQFDLRFPIIADRYRAPSGRARDMEDLKARYVDVTRRVLSRFRHPLADPPTKALLNALHFDPEKERIRKAHVRALQSRTQAEVDEEDRLHALLLDMEAHQLLITRERTEVLSRFFKGYDPQYMADYNAQRSEYKEKIMVNGPASTMVTIDGILDYGKEAKLTPGVSVRSAGIRGLKPAVVARIGPIMQGMYKIRPSTFPIMCTSRLAAAFEETRSAIMQKLDLQKQVEKAEADLRAMRGGSVGGGYGKGASHLGKGKGKGSALAHHDKRAVMASSPHPMGDGRDRKRARRN